MTIGIILKMVRARLHISQQEMANKLGISQNYLSLLESDKREPSSDKIAQFAESLGFSKDALMLASSKVPSELKGKDKETYARLQKTIISVLFFELTGDIEDIEKSA